MNKYSQKLLTLISIIIIICLLYVSSFAINQTEIDKIKKILKNEETFVVTESNGVTIDANYYNDYNIDNAKKIYFSETLMLTSYEEAKTVDSIISEKYQWCVPLGEDEENVAIFSVKEEGITLSGSRPSKGYYLSDDEICEIIENSNIKPSTINSIERVFSPMYYTMFTIIETTSATYCIPFSSNTELIGLENKKMYAFEDMMQILIKRFDESKLLESHDSFGGVPLRDNNSILVTAIIITSLVLIIVCSVLLIKRKKIEIKQIK